MTFARLAVFIVALAGAGATDLSSFTGLWTASCGAGILINPNSDRGEQTFVMHYRMIRAAGPSSIEVLEFAWEHLNFYDYPQDLQFAPTSTRRLWSNRSASLTTA